MHGQHLLLLSVETLVCKGWDLTKQKPTKTKQVLKARQSHLPLHADTVASTKKTYPCLDKEAVRKLLLVLKLIALSQES